MIRILFRFTGGDCPVSRRISGPFRASAWLCLWVGITAANLTLPSKAADDLAWPAIERTQRPWTYWWWMASAVDPANITKELTRYRDAGLGGVHIIPIYGAKGFESNYISYLSPRWMEMMRHTVTEAERLGLGVDMTTGSGWCFGGPRVTDDEANATLVSKQVELANGERLQETFDRQTTQALMAFGPKGEKIDLLPQLGADGIVDWTAERGSWRVFAISQKPSAQRVKRPGPGGEGWMLNLFYAQAMTNFLNWFGEPFESYHGPKPRAQYHDSYEYKSEWSPDLFAQFEKRRGYRLQDELPALSGLADTDRVGRVKSDYRETVSELMSDVTLPLWVKWSHDHGFITRNEAHGSPGNLLDLYAVADIPETEMFHTDRNKLISKFASSAAHVTGKPLVGSETGTWLEEHFTETLADMKYLLDDLFLSGVNHVFYHGTCYSPDEAGWPGWLFYASYEMNPRNSIWHDVPALNAYVARCQSMLQAGKPANDVLLYWPIHDRWSNPKGMVQPFTVHAREWFEDQPVGKAAERLWNRGYQFDFISDKQLGTASYSRGRVSVAGGNYRVVVVPKCERMPVQTLSNLVSLVKAGATVIFQDQLPSDVPGLGRLEARRSEFAKLIEEAKQLQQPARLRGGRVIVADPELALAIVRVSRETLFDRAGLMCIRRETDAGRNYFIANRGTNTFEGWLPLASGMRGAVLKDPLGGRSGVGLTRNAGDETGEVYLQLAPGESIMVQAFSKRKPRGAEWDYLKPAADVITLKGKWQVQFVSGDPELPAGFETEALGSWTAFGDTTAQRFAGTARYTLRFDATAKGPAWLDLGRVAQSAIVRLNGEDLGTLITPPFRVLARQLKSKDNQLEVEATNVSANRIRDLDQRQVNWKNFRDINFVNIDYRPFDASNWPLTDSGLLGPVTVQPVTKSVPR